MYYVSVYCGRLGLCVSVFEWKGIKHERSSSYQTFLPHFLAAENFRMRAQPITNFQHVCHNPPLNLPDFKGQLCHRPSKFVTSFSVAVARSASLGTRVKPKVIRHRQHQSRLSKVFPLNAWASSCRRFRATFEKFTTWSTSLTIVSQDCLPSFQIGLLLFSSPTFVKSSPASNHLSMLPPNHEVHLALFYSHKRQ